MKLKVGIHPQAVTAPPRAESRARGFFLPRFHRRPPSAAGAARSAEAVIRSAGKGTGDMDFGSEPRQVMRVPASPNLPPEISIAASTVAAGLDECRGVCCRGPPGRLLPLHLCRYGHRLSSECGHPSGVEAQSPVHTIPQRSRGADDHPRRSRERAPDRPLESLAYLDDRRESDFRRLPSRSGTAHGSRVEIVETFNNRGAELWTLGQRLAERIGSPLPGSRLYAESLSTQIAIHLLWNHSSLTPPEGAAAERLTDLRLRRVVDFIHASLGNEISLGELADLAGLSPNYFLSAFRKATGKTPHRYLTEQRIARACELLHNPHCSLVDVSLTVGFSSQSHLTTVFRRFMKTTPAAYREEILGLRLIRSPGAEQSERGRPLPERPIRRTHADRKKRATVPVIS